MILKSQMPALWTSNDILLVNTVLNSGFKVPDEQQITEACNDGVDDGRQVSDPCNPWY